MTRKHRRDYPGAKHHVILKAVAGWDLFRDDLDRRRFVERLLRLLREHGVRCLAWSLMGNHVHLLLQTGACPISLVLHRLATGHAMAINRRYGRQGHLFQGRFKSWIVADAGYLLQLVRYIHLNPIRAGIVDDLDALVEHRWTGHPALVGAREPTLIEPDWVLAMFGATRAEARTELRRLMEHDLHVDECGRPMAWIAAVDSEGKRAIPAAPAELGSSVVHGVTAFVEGARTTAGVRAERRFRLSRAGWTLERLIGAAADRTGAEPDAVRGGSRTTAAANARALVALHAVEDLGLSRRMVASAVGVSATAITKRLGRGLPIGVTPLWPREAGVREVTSQGRPWSAQAQSGGLEVTSQG